MQKNRKVVAISASFAVLGVISASLLNLATADSVVLTAVKWLVKWGSGFAVLVMLLSIYGLIRKK